MTRFRLHDDVAVVEHDGGQPIENGRIMWGTVTQVGSCSVYATYGPDDIPRMFLLDSRGRAWNSAGKWRLVPVCHRTECENPVLDPCTDPGDLLGRQWCSLDCMGTDAEAAHEMRMRGAF